MALLCADGVSGHLEQMGAHRIEAVVARQPRLDLVEQSESALGPWAIAAAIVRLRLTIGLPVICSNNPYRARI